MRFAVIGDPVAHSKSPAMHGAAYRALGLPHAYGALPVRAADLPAVVADLRRGAFDGLNVTVPHKVAVLSLVDEVDDSARTVGAANTLVRLPGGRLRAHNTDAPALARELEVLAARLAPWSRGEALVLGAGGAARSAVVALALGLRVPHIEVRARGEAAKGAAFAAEMTTLLRAAGAAVTVVAAPLAPSPEREANVVAIVQGTSAGMVGAAPGDGVAAAVAWDAVPAGAVALDVVYAPPETPFLRAAMARGLRHASGFGMLARQGALAFELWLGVPAPYEVMLAALL